MTRSFNLRPFLLMGLVVLLACLFPLTAGAQESLKADHVKVRWLAPQTFGAGTETVGVLFEVDPHWHVYWKNPGDSGVEPKFTFTGSSASVGDVLWPAPVRLPIAHLTNFGYDGNVAYMFEVTPQAGAKDVTLKLDLEWLVCQNECIPGFGKLELHRPLGASAQWPADALALRDQYLARVPKAATASPWKLVSAQAQDNQVAIEVQGAGANGETAPALYPTRGRTVAPAQPQAKKTAAGWRYTFKSGWGSSDRPEALGFVLTDGDNAWEMPDIALTTGSTLPPADDTPLWWLLAASFIGGIILNLMPCVFPVLALKVFSMVGTDETGLKQRLREGLLYTAGVLATFALLGGVFLALRAGGAAVGWGFQLQSPAVVMALLLLFWVMALSFLGAYEFGYALTRLGGKASGSFATGVLAVFVAAPCTGPFMGAALGASATLPPVQAMGIFLGLGAGLAAPFLLLAAVPALANKLPRPGAWMDTLKQVLAFPLFATVLWLLWVLGKLGGDDGWLLGGLAILAISFALWLARSSRTPARIAGGILALLVLGVGLPKAEALSAPQAVADRHADWQPYDAQKIADARAQGQAVFIDYTAAWCITCQVNKQVVLNTAATAQLFDANKVLRVRADWTRYDPAITAALAKLGRNSVPVYVFYPADGGEATILPQILTPDDISGLFKP